LIVVDTSAVIAIFFDEPEARDFATAIHRSGRALMTAPSALETALVAHGRRPETSSEALDELFKMPSLSVVAWTADLLPAAREALLRFGKGRHPAKLNYGDCMSYALAKSLDAPLLYKGTDFGLTDIRSAV
jgi:ribonuclease VapC